MGTSWERAAAASGPTVTGFAGTRFRVDGQVHDGGVILTPHEAIAWNAAAISELAPADVEQALALGPPPEFLLLGTGAALARPPTSFTAALEARGIGVEAMDSRAAARAWAVLRAEDRWIAAALMPL